MNEREEPVERFNKDAVHEVTDCVDVTIGCQAHLIFFLNWQVETLPDKDVLCCLGLRLTLENLLSNFVAH